MGHVLFGNTGSIPPVGILPLFHFPAGESLNPLAWPTKGAYLASASPLASLLLTLLCRHVDFLSPTQPPPASGPLPMLPPGFRNSTLSSHPISPAFQLILSLLSTKCKEMLLPYAFPDHHQHLGELSPLLYAPRIPIIYSYLYCLYCPIARKIHEGRNLYVFHSHQSSSIIKLVLYFPDLLTRS